MTTDRHYEWRPGRPSYPPPDLNAPLPPLPRPSRDARDYHEFTASDSPFNGETYSNRRGDQMNNSHGIHHSQQDPFTDDAAIPLQPQYTNQAGKFYPGLDRPLPQEPYPPGHPSPQEPRRRQRVRRFFTRHTPWVTYTLTAIQIAVFIAELIKNAILTGTPIEIHPSVNPMLGPSSYLLIAMGGRYVPCMRSQSGVQDSVLPISWPCPNQTTTTASCSLSDLCAFSGVPNPVVNGSIDASPAPNQWFRFITPIFLHAGIVHIGFNMLLQVLLGADMERIIGHIRFFIVYFASGICGFAMGGVFAPAGIVSTGASGSLFGIIALLLLDLFYTWRTRITPIRDLLYIICDILVSFVLGLLPGVDNFSHIGGFAMGLLLGLSVLRSPAALREKRVALQQDGVINVGVSGTAQPEDDWERPGKAGFSTTTTMRASSPPGFPPLPARPQEKRPRTSAGYILFSLLRMAALVGAVAILASLLRSFYTHHSTECGWCKYLSCLPVKDWCNIGDLTFTDQYSNETSARMAFF